ncbi:hypothetical protein EU527_16120 [Candidatus Thorarchaeota archaeon]|nr:MAG: hypothetical protein EU527_16120 [Candidatus Thorarchaeota archaeon]
MNDISEAQTSESGMHLKEKLRAEDAKSALLTTVYGIIGAFLFAMVYSIPMPYTMVSLIKFGLSPALAIIAVVGAIRGPVAGFLSGYLGLALYDFIFFNAIVSMTLPALSYGVLGLIVGMASYDFTNGRSLIKLSILSAIGLIFTALFAVVFGLFVVNHSVLLELGFVLLPMFTVGIPSVILITPILARFWHMASTRITIPCIKNRIL